ncbi:oxidoreductase [Luteibacter rhizovicinus DSM 16549]|uniref:Oxidoreductase n=1 Tax=Luteibacter rhizovicinus DSM 16549 TaxID=1440763 RepID=A0A0G9HED1_9GAMM|nr:aldo/keto reductase [Luteibacter rhizovicinus]APG05410.1 oxidoreductase [Luteibacter rhizovicinus DSM 16549]KLD68028.1 oxidoreductase [Luteibacter rhizovicinus DSM 16549]KLD73365.1 oxidoreductase [Xanthomonas hyacinthi DSM 19077]
MTSSVPVLDLNDGNKAPQLGFGVFQIPDGETADAVASALAAGYRSLDTAAIYKNEAGVRQGIERSGVARGDIFLTTKLWNAEQGFDSTLKAFDASLAKLGTDYVDMYLIHWPTPKRDLYIDTWKAFIRLRDEGRIRSIGVSNFQPAHLERLVKETGVVPVVNQIELHPDFAQNDVVAANTKLKIITESWSPLGQGGDLLKNEALIAIGKKHGKTPAQVVIRWHVQLGHMVIPKSVTPERIKANIDVFDFELSADEMKAIDALDAGNRMGPHPDQLN